MRGSSNTMEYDWSKRFSLLAQRTRPPEISWLMAQALEVPGLISLAAGFVDQESLPHEEVSRILEPLLREKSAGQAALQYGTTQGDLELRQLLVQRLRAEGVFHPAAKIDESHMLIGSGSQQVLYLAAEALLDEGDIILLEAPTYFVVLGILQSRNLRTFGIDTDADGIVVEKVEECLAALEKRGEISRVKMLYLMSYATNPLGITLAPERRKRLLALLQSYREKGYPILLLEDAAYRRLGFADPIPHPIKSLEADNDLVLYTESFSKTLSPGFRLGFGVGPKSLIDKMVDLKGNQFQFKPAIAQNHLKQRHVRRSRPNPAPGLCAQMRNGSGPDGGDLSAASALVTAHRKFLHLGYVAGSVGHGAAQRNLQTGVGSEGAVCARMPLLLPGSPRSRTRFQYAALFWHDRRTTIAGGIRKNRTCVAGSDGVKRRTLIAPTMFISLPTSQIWYPVGYKMSMDSFVKMPLRFT